MGKDNLSYDQLLIAITGNLALLNSNEKAVLFTTDKDNPAKIIFDNLILVRRAINLGLSVTEEHLDMVEDLVEKFDAALKVLTFKKQTFSSSNQKGLEKLKADWNKVKIRFSEIRHNPDIARSNFEKAQIQSDEKEKKKKSTPLTEKEYDTKDESWKTDVIAGRGRNVGFKEQKVGDVLVVHAQGQRPSQEDYHAVREIDAELNERTAIQALSCSVAVAKERGQAIANEFNSKGAGSTLDGVLEFSDGGKRKIAAVNLGDTKAYVGREIEGKTVLIPLTKDHSLDEAEQKRIRKGGGVIIPDNKGNLRVNGMISVTRGIGGGDAFEVVENRLEVEKYHEKNDEEKKQLKHVRPKMIQGSVIKGTSTPDITLYETIPQDRFKFQACDGLFETLSVKEIEAIINYCYSKKIPHKIPEALTKAAFLTGSGDNIGVLMSPIGDVRSKPKFTGFFDGNNGSAVADDLGKEFGEIVNSFAKEISKEKDGDFKAGPGSMPGKPSSDGALIENKSRLGVNKR